MPRLADSSAFWIILPRFRFQTVLSLFAVFRNANIWVLCFRQIRLDAEIRHRVPKRQLAHRQVRRTILMNKYISVPVRLRLLEALILQVLLPGAGRKLGLLATPQLHKWQVVYMRWIRSIVGNGFWADDQVPDVQLQLYWRLPGVALRLAKLRLFYAFHLFGGAPGQVIDMVTAVAGLPRSWFAAFRQALFWPIRFILLSFLVTLHLLRPSISFNGLHFIVMMVLAMSVVFANELKLRALSLGRFGLRTIV